MNDELSSQLQSLANYDDYEQVERARDFFQAEGVRFVSQLRELLEQCEGDDGLTIVEAMGYSRCPAFVADLVPLLEKDDFYLVLTTISALGRIGGDVVVPHLITKLGVHPEFDYEIVSALGEVGAPAEPFLIDAAKGHNPEVSPGFAVWALGGIKTRKTVRTLIHILNGDDRKLREGAATSLGDLMAEKAVPHLIRTLKRKQVGRYAAAALGKIGDPAAVPALIASLDQPNVRHAAIYALGQLRDRRAVKPLIKVTEERQRDTTEWALVAGALGEIADIRAQATLIQLLADIEVQVRIAAAKALGNMESIAAVPALVEATYDSDSGVRDAAKRTLAILSNQAVPKIAELLTVDDRRLRHQAKKALRDLGTAEALAALNAWQEEQENKDR